DLTVGVRELEADRGGKAVAHRGKAVRDEERPRPERGPALRADRLVVADVAGDERVLGKRGAQLGEDLLRGEAVARGRDVCAEVVAERGELLLGPLGLRTRAQ